MTLVTRLQDSEQFVLSGQLYRAKESLTEHLHLDKHQ